MSLKVLHIKIYYIQYLKWASHPNASRAHNRYSTRAIFLALYNNIIFCLSYTHELPSLISDSIILAFHITYIMHRSSVMQQTHLISFIITSSHMIQQEHAKRLMHTLACKGRRVRRGTWAVGRDWLINAKRLEKFYSLLGADVTVKRCPSPHPSRAWWSLLGWSALLLHYEAVLSCSNDRVNGSLFYRNNG